MPSHKKRNGNEVDALLFENVKATPQSHRFFLAGEEVDLARKPFLQYHSLAPDEYIRLRILEAEKSGQDVFPEIVGKNLEKELVKDALFSGSPIIFRGEKGYGKTTFSKAIAKLLPERLLTIDGCSIHDDPIQPKCFSCRSKLISHDEIHLAWTPRIWVRIPGDPMLTTRQLIGGISIQKIREGYDLDSPDVFIPGRALKANRGVGYFDELGAIPTSLQTMLHELFEEGQVSTSEGDIFPLGISSIEVASTNPANYKGTSPIKEPLLDRMEAVEIGPPATLEEEIEIATRNLHSSSLPDSQPSIPYWHERIIARNVRFARNSDESEIASKLQVRPSCRATIKLFDHVLSKALIGGRRVPLLRDYGDEREMLKLALAGRIELDYGVKETKEDIIRSLFEEALKETSKEMYDLIPDEDFEVFYKGILKCATKENGHSYLSIDETSIKKLKNSTVVHSTLKSIINGNEDHYVSAVEILLLSMSLCIPSYVERRGTKYYLKASKLEEIKRDALANQAA
ncbi:MAG: ATPase [Nitrososphaerales archaeon]